MPADSDASEKVTDPDELRGLLRLLHDLGTVVAHGLRDGASASLREVTLLDPNWLTGAIYRLLTHPTVRDQQGEFSRTQMTQLLDPADYPVSRHEFILDMMQHEAIGLTFELPGTTHQRFLIPEALPKKEPDYGTWPEDALRFRFSYEYLPSGLIPRFIVELHQNLSKLPTRWRTGVVLEAASCPVLIRGDVERRQVEIRAAGPTGQRRGALNVVLNSLEHVNARFGKEIGAKAMVPLPDDPSVPYRMITYSG